MAKKKTPQLMLNACNHKINVCILHELDHEIHHVYNCASKIVTICNIVPKRSLTLSAENTGFIALHDMYKFHSIFSVYSLLLSILTEKNKNNYKAGFVG